MQPPAAQTLPGLLAEMAARDPDRPFLTDGARRWTYGSFLAESRRLARSLAALGVRPGERVAILMENRAEWLLGYFAAAALGAPIVALNTWWRAGELAHALTLTGASTLLMVDRYLRHDYTAELAAAGPLPALRHVVCLGGTSPPGATGFDGLGAMSAEPSGDAGPDDVACILFTSGSTARAKAVPLLHRGLIANMWQIGERLQLTEQDRLLMAVSLFWSFGCANALFALMTHGGSIVLQGGFDVGESLALIERERCTVLYVMPNMALALRDHPDRARRDLASLRTGITLPAAVPAIAEMIPEITSCYGLTEGYGNSMVTDCKAPLAVRARTSGTALPGNEIGIADPATRRPVPPGEAGEVRIRGNVTPGYWSDPEATRAAFDADGWFYTGDLAHLDPAGRLVFHSRIKEMIKTGGINVAPAEVEALLESHPAVRQAVVVGLPDPEREEIVAAMVALHDGAAATEDSLIAHCRAAAAAFKVPRRLVIVRAEEIALTDTGKVSKQRVREALLSSASPA